MFNDFRYKNVEQVHAFSFWHRQLNRFDAKRFGSNDNDQIEHINKITNQTNIGGKKATTTTTTFTQQKTEHVFFSSSIRRWKKGKLKEKLACNCEIYLAFK